MFHVLGGRGVHSKVDIPLLDQLISERLCLRKVQAGVDVNRGNLLLELPCQVQDRNRVLPEAAGEAFNIASGTETKIIDLAKMINEVTGNENGVRFVKRRTWDRIYKRRASIKKAKRVIGYEPRIETGEGLKSTVDWFLRNTEIIASSARF